MEIFETPSETQGCYKALEKGRLLTEDRVRELGEGWKFPVPPPEELANMASLEGVDEDHLKLLYSRATPQPLRTYTQPLRLENPAREGLPKLGILCSFSLAQVRDDRQRQPLVPRDGEPELAVRRTPYGSLSDVLKAR